MRAKPVDLFGCHFRSRLEARWAVFFEALGLDWEYEPESARHPKVYYQPDFRVTLPILVPVVTRVHCYWSSSFAFEVKPEGWQGRPEAKRKIIRFVAAGRPLVLLLGDPQVSTIFFYQRANQRFFRAQLQFAEVPGGIGLLVLWTENTDGQRWVLVEDILAPTFRAWCYGGRVGIARRKAREFRFSGK